MNPKKNHEVFAQYIDQYTQTIEKTIETLRENKYKLQIPYAQFMFSMIDYFGLLYIVASKGTYNKFDKQNFINFLQSDYFPSKDHCKASLLWFIRNGLFHQIFPKASGISSSSENTLFFRDGQNRNNPILNLNYLDIILNEAIQKFIKDLMNNTDYINNAHKILIEEHYGLDDYKEFQIEVNKSFSGDHNKIFSDCIHASL